MFDIQLLENTIDNYIEGNLPVKDIGILEIGGKAYKLTYTFSNIFANEKPILHTYNDANTAATIFAKTLQASVGDSFIPNKDFKL
jgi:hypothetical protein